MDTHALKRRLRAGIGVAVAMAALAVPASAYAECSGTVIHRAAVYANSNGTGFIKNKEIGEHISGPQNGFYWVAGAEAPWVEVNVSGGSHGWMDINEIGSLTCNDPWP